MAWVRLAQVAAILIACAAGCASKSDSDPAARASRIAAMANSRPSDGGAELVEALGDSDPTVRKAAAFALSSCLTEQNQPALIKATRDSDAEVRAGAVATLSMYKDKVAAQRLGEILAGDADELVQTYAASGLEMNPSPDAMVALLENVEKNPSMATRKLAMRYMIGKIGVRLLREVDPLSREWAGLVQTMKNQKAIQDAYAACNVTLEHRPLDRMLDTPGIHHHDDPSMQKPAAAKGSEHEHE